MAETISVVNSNFMLSDVDAFRPEIYCLLLLMDFSVLPSVVTIYIGIVLQRNLGVNYMQ